MSTTSQPGAPAIRVRGLTKTYSSYKKQAGFAGTVRSLFKRERIEVTAVRDVSFDVAPGELIGFIGPNGAGKTTTLKVLSGILWPTSGEASVLGYTPWKRQREYQRQFAIVMGQKNQLWWDLPATDGFVLNKEIYDVPTADFERRVKTLSERLDVAGLLEVPIRKLSLGERMKCELINALLHNPRVLLLDEPTIGLDVVSQQAIREFLREWNQREGTTILLTSHQMDDVEALCKRVVIIHSGTLSYDGALDTLVQRHVKHKVVTVTFTQPVERGALAGYGTLADFAPVRASLQVPRGDVREVAKRLLDALPVDDILVEEASLDAVVRDIFRAGGR